MIPTVQLDFVNGVGTSTSLNLVADYVIEGLERKAVEASRTRGALGHVRAVLQMRTRPPVLVLVLAHYLGRAALESPRILLPRRRALMAGWEIEQLPDNFSEELAGADVLLGISDYNAAVFRMHFPDTPVISVPVCPPLPDRAEPDRRRWGIPEDAVVFLNVFDSVSGFDRKNPVDVYDAFERGFGDRDDVRLVFKVHGGFAKNPDEGDLAGEESRAAQFLELCASDDRVILVDEFLSYRDLLCLMSSCDAYVSLARAEGLGLPVLEAMALGLPTVCTAYSGHLAFARADSNLLVPYDLVDISQTASHYYHPRAYSTPPRWAQPRIDIAAEHLRNLADDPALRRRLSEQGHRAASAYQKRSAEFTWVAELESALCSAAVQRNHLTRDFAFQRVVRRDRAVWVKHERRVSRAKLVLALRSRLGRVKRTVLARR